MSNRERLLEAIHEKINEAVNQGREIDKNELALSLSSTFQLNGIPISDICNEIDAALANRPKSTA